MIYEFTDMFWAPEPLIVEPPPPDEPDTAPPCCHCGEPATHRCLMYCHCVEAYCIECLSELIQALSVLCPTRLSCVKTDDEVEMKKISDFIKKTTRV